MSPVWPRAPVSSARSGDAAAAPQPPRVHRGSGRHAPARPGALGSPERTPSLPRAFRAHAGTRAHTHARERHGARSTSGRTQRPCSHASPRHVTRRGVVSGARDGGVLSRPSRRRTPGVGGHGGVGGGVFFYPETAAPGPGDESVSPRREPDWPLGLAWAPRSPTPPPARRGGWCRAAPGPPRAAASEL